MKEHPILFSTPMVEAILEGRKTQTRRVIKPQSDYDGLWDDTKFPRSLESTLKGWNGTVEATGVGKEFKCPYGNEGDVLWVRETWSEITKSGERFYLYKTSDSWGDAPKDAVTWKPSIHMPKDACRLKLEITNIRVERLHDISEEDAKAEGVEKQAPFVSYYTYFHQLWQKINGENSWQLNPWVWAIKFKKL